MSPATATGSKMDTAYGNLRQALIACGAEPRHNRVSPRSIEVLSGCSARTASKLYRDLLDGPYLDANGFLVKSPAEWQA